MLMGRPCVICSHRDRRTIDEAISSGVNDYKIAEQWGLVRRTVGRHRVEHLTPMIQNRAALLAKDRPAQQERQELAAAAASDSPSTQALIEATLGMRRQMEKLNNIEARLERMATNAEAANSPQSVAQLSAQQLRSVEVGSRLGATGGYRPPSVIAPIAEKAVVSIEMVFPNANRRETIRFADRPVLDGDVVEPPAPGETLPKPVSSQKFQPDDKLDTYWGPDQGVRGRNRNDLSED
jgi:hypothetical protein